MKGRGHWSKCRLSSGHACSSNMPLAHQLIAAKLPKGGVAGFGCVGIALYACGMATPCSDVGSPASTSPTGIVFHLLERNSDPIPISFWNKSMMTKDPIMINVETASSEGSKS